MDPTLLQPFIDRRYSSLLTAFRGLTQRQVRLLSLAARVRGTWYVDQGMRPWWPAMGRDRAGRVRLFSCEEREPGIQVGIIGEKVGKLMDKLVGEGRLPAFKNMPEKVEAILLDEDQIDLVDAIYLPAFDLAVKGAACMGFSRIGVGDARVFEPLYLDVTWCQPIFAAEARSDKAKRYAVELDKLGVPRDDPGLRDFLAVPEGARSGDLIALRYQPTWIDEEKNEVWRARVDFLPNVTVEFQPMRVETDSKDEIPPWIPVDEPDPHDWGLVPLTWVRSRGAIPGESEGPSLISPELITIAKAMDLTESLRHDSVRAIAWPQLTLIDVVDKMAADWGDDLTFALPTTQDAGSGTIAEYRSDGDHPSVQTIEPDGAGLQRAAEEVADLRGHADHVSGIQEHDQKEAAGALSGVALEKMLEPTIATVNRYRRPLGKLMRQLAVKLGRVIGDEEGTEKIVCQWPRVVSSTPDDLAKAATALQAANGGRPVISHKSAVLIFANLAELPDPEEEFKAIEKETQELEDKMFGTGGPQGAQGASKGTAPGTGSAPGPGASQRKDEPTGEE